MKGKSVKAKVTKRGFLILKEMLAGVEEVEIRKEDRRIVISPLTRRDPILQEWQRRGRVEASEPGVRGTSQSCSLDCRPE